MGQRVVRDALRAAGASRVYAVPKSLAASMGAGLPMNGAESRLVIDLGAGITEIGVVSMGMLTAARSIAYGGRDLDEALRRFLWRAAGVSISSAEAEQLKLRIGAVDPAQASNSIDLSALAAPAVDVKIQAAELAAVLAEAVEPLIDQIQWAIEQLGAQQREEIRRNGGVLCGGGALLRGIDKLLTKELGVPAYPVDNPTTCVVEGASLAMEPGVYAKIKRNLPPV